VIDAVFCTYSFEMKVEIEDEECFSFTIKTDKPSTEFWMPTQLKFLPRDKVELWLYQIAQEE